MKNKFKKIALIGGGSGGHVYPLIAVAEELMAISSEMGIDMELRMFGDGQFIRKAAQEKEIKFRRIIGAKWRRYFSIYNFLDLFKIPVGIFQSFLHIWLFMPDIVFAKGGYSSFIPTLIARFYLIPVVIHESDSVPGKVNKILGKLAKKIFVSFESSKSYFKEKKTEVVGNPVRTILAVSRIEANKFFNFSNSKPTILIMGGSQGAQKINDTVVNSLSILTSEFNIIHQVGVANYKKLKSEKIETKSYKIYPFFDYKTLVLAYGASDVVVNRAGAGGLFEASAQGKPMIVIPIIGSASNHQQFNAREIEKYGAVIIQEQNLSPNILISQIKKIIINKKEISMKISEFARPNATNKIAKYIIAQ